MSAVADSILLGYQRRWLADKSRVKLCGKSRRIGLTWAQAADDVLLAATAGRDGMDVLYISFNQDMTREYIDACAEWARRYSKAAQSVREVVFKDGDEREIKAFRIDFASGHKILALSSRPSNLRGKQGRVVIDEAAFVEDLLELLKSALALLMWGGQVVVISTHNGVENAFNDVIAEARSGRCPYSVHRITLDDALADGLYKRICSVGGREWTPEGEAEWRADLIRKYGDGADEELFCIPRRSGGAWISGELVESCVDDTATVLRWSPPVAGFVDLPLPDAAALVEEWLQAFVAGPLEAIGAARCWIGSDFGRSGDLTVDWFISEDEKGNMHTPLVLELRDAPFRTQEHILEWCVRNLLNFQGISVDARGNGQARAEFARQAFGAELVNEVMLTEGWYREHMPRVKTALEDRIIALPRDAEIKNDLRSLRVVRGVARVPERRVAGSGGSRHCDAAIALALAMHARATLTSGDYEYTPAAPKAPAYGADFDDDEAGAGGFNQGAW